MPDPSAPLVRVKFWGVRGSLPSPGPATTSVGGNTACVEIRVDDRIIILDAGTGIRELGVALGEEFKETPLDLALLISHTHWDHIHGLPFFQPAYRAGNRLRIFGCKSPGMGLGEALSRQMEPAWFPVPMASMPADITVTELNTATISIGPVEIRVARVNHPGAALGYRLQTGRGAIVYIPDCEPAGMDAPPVPCGAAAPGPFIDATGPGLVEFIRDADLLIMDGQYDRREYVERTGWGHACIEDTVAAAASANVKQLCIFHHDPGHDDARVLQKIAGARQQAQEAGSPLKIEAAREGMEIFL